MRYPCCMNPTVNTNLVSTVTFALLTSINNVFLQIWKRLPPVQQVINSDMDDHLFAALFLYCRYYTMGQVWWSCLCEKFRPKGFSAGLGSLYWDVCCVFDSTGWWEVQVTEVIVLSCLFVTNCLPCFFWCCCWFSIEIEWTVAVVIFICNFYFYLYVIFWSYFFPLL